ncbi:MAG: outer membrane protein assembly factor BamA [Bacteroidota bacterium]
MRSAFGALLYQSHRGVGNLRAVNARRQYCLLLLWFLGLLGSIVHTSADLRAQDTYRDSLELAGERSRVLQLTELRSVEIVGCQQTVPEDLRTIIASRQSDFSLGRKLTIFFEQALRRNPASPPVILRRLSSIRKSYDEERVFFELAMARDDSTTLLNYLVQNGFHNARVDFGYGYDRQTKLFTLRFLINEGRRATIDTFIVRGLETVDPDVRRSALNTISIRQGSPFSESLIEENARSLVRQLQNNGYYKASYERPLVGISDNGEHDTVIVLLKPGRRVRVESIDFVENTDGYPAVTLTTRQRQLDFAAGEWYSKELVEQSRANLMGLGTFEIVLIDTVAHDSSYRGSDTSVRIRVFTRNSKPYDVGVSVGPYQTAIDNFLNLGITATAQYRNMFGGAQVASITMQYTLQDISRFAQGQQLEREFNSSFILAWPNLGRLFSQRVGLTTSTFYSNRQLITPFRLESFGVNAQAPIAFYSHTFFNAIDLNIGIDRQIPINFGFAINSAYDEAETAEDTALVRSTYNQFLVLTNYLSQSKSFFTGLTAGFTLRGDHRDNQLNPSQGTFSSISLEWGWGAGKYIRGQAFISSAVPVGHRLIAAGKIKLGHIELLDFARGDSLRNNTYVPLDRQFFAGGPASIRSYASRRLHDPNSGVIRNVDPDESVILSNVVGSGSLIELGFELRYTLPRPRGVDELWAGIIERSGITLFTDIGNAFNRFTTELYGSVTPNDLISGSVVAMGLGYRFETPVGPFRVDYATSVYDPLRSEGRWITDRTAVMASSNWQLSIGIGHAF